MSDDRCFCGDELESIGQVTHGQGYLPEYEVEWCPECGRLRIRNLISMEDEWKTPCRAV